MNDCFRRMLILPACVLILAPLNDAHATPPIKKAKAALTTKIPKGLTNGFTQNLAKTTGGYAGSASISSAYTPQLSTRQQAIVNALEEAKRQAANWPKLFITPKKATVGRLSLEAIAKQQQHKMDVLDANPFFSVAYVEEDPAYGSLTPMDGTVFFIEEIYQSKKYLWGVTAAHITDITGPHIQVFFNVGKPRSLSFRTKIAVQGNTGMVDMAIFPVSDEMKPFVQPLSIAKKRPAAGDVLRSYGFFDGGFHIVKDRVVETSTASRIVTSLEFNTTNRSGACGGPVINVNNEIVGLHCGSSESKGQSFVVPIAQVKELFYAYRNGNVSQTHMVLNGKTLGRINIDEYIYSVVVKKNGSVLREMFPWRNEVKVDYAHLENLVSLNNADEVEMILVKGGTLQTGATDNVTKTLVTYDLETEEITRMTF